MKHPIHIDLQPFQYTAGIWQALKSEDFAAILNQIRPNSDNAIEIWIEWANDLRDLNSESDDQFHRTSENYLNEFATYIVESLDKYGVSVAQDLIHLSELKSCPFPWEIRMAAKYLSNGTRPEDIWPLIEQEMLDDDEQYFHDFPNPA